MNPTFPSSNPSIHAPSARSCTALVVDDEFAIRELLVMILNHQGYEVLSAESAGEALAMVGAWDGELIDLLVTDLMMPGMDGAALAGELRELLPALKVIFTSGYSTDDPAALRLDLRNAIYLSKPASFRSMAAAIGALFESTALA